MRAALYIAVLAAGAAACRDQPSAKDARSGEDEALIVALQSDGQTLDPHLANDAPSMRLIENLYCTLLRYGDGPEGLVGDLALEWERSEDGKRYTFKLDPRARFHHSRRTVTSKDVAFSVERIRDGGARAQQFEFVERIDTPDPHTVVFVLREPVAAFATYLAHPMNAIVDGRAIEEGAALEGAEAGSGPFVLERWRRNAELVLRRFDDYHLGPPHLEEVVIRPMPDETARMTALRTGEVHLVLDVPLREIDRLRANPQIVVEAVPGTFWEYVGVNLRRPPLDDARVRRAIAHAIDRTVLNTLVKRGEATPLVGGHLPPNHWAHADISEYDGRDLDAARALLKEAGAEGTTLVLKVGSAFKEQVRAAQVVKQQLRDAGLDVKIEALESGIFFDALGRGDFDLTVVGWVGFVDPDEWTYELFHSDGKWNQQGYASEQMDALLKEGRFGRTLQARKATYAQVQRVLAGDVPMVFLYVNPHVSAWRRGLVGFDVAPTATTRSLRDVRWEGR